MRVQSLGYDEGLVPKAIENKVSLAIRASILGVDSHSADDVDAEHSISSQFRLDHAESFVAVHDSYRPHVQFNRELGKKVAIVEGRIFLRECIQRCVQSALSIPVEAFSSMSEFDDWRNSGQLRLLILSLAEGGSQESANPLGMLSELAASAPIIVLSPSFNFELMRAVIGYGAKGYIPMTMGFEIAIEAVRFVLAGGTYVPAECLLSGIPSASPPSQGSAASGAITAREMAVVRAIQQGKPNKIIAYELNMCESTVKVHVRHVMKKLRAKNRTDVAIKATDLLSCSRCIGQNECWSTGRCLRKVT